MPGKSNQSRTVTIRLDNYVYDKIAQAIKKPDSEYMSVGEYVKNHISWWALRTDRNYRWVSGEGMKFRKDRMLL